MVCPGVSRIWRRSPGKFERVALFHGDELVLSFGSRAQPNLRAATVAQFEMSCKKVGVEVSEKDVADLYAELFGIVKILLDVTLRVDHDGGCARFVGDQVGCVGEAAQIVLLEEHAPDSRTRSGGSWKGFSFQDLKTMRGRGRRNAGILHCVQNDNVNKTLCSSILKSPQIVSPA